MAQQPCSKVSWTDLSRFVVENSLSVCTINVRSLKNKFQEVVSHLNILKNKISFIIITETWLLPENDLVMDIEGYKAAAVYRDGRGGGIKIYYLETISAIILPELTSNGGCCETLFFKANVPGFGKLAVGGVYRPPNSNPGEFLNFLSENINYLGGMRSVVAGDFNINICNPTSTADDYIDVMTSFGFTNNISLKTYVSPITNEDVSCIDHIWHNLDILQKSYVVYPNIADHYCATSVFAINIDNVPIVIKFRNFSESNQTKFLENVHSEFSSCNPPTHDIDLFENYFTNFLKLILDKYFPIKLKTITQKRLRAPWITGDIMACIKKKHFWYKLAKLNKITFESYKSYCKILRKILRLAEENYHTKKLDSLGTDTKKNWKLLNKLLGRKSTDISDHFIISGASVTDPNLIANEFNKYFIEQPREIVNNIPDAVENYLDVVPLVESQWDFLPTDPDEVANIIKKLKNNSSITDIPTFFLNYAQIIFRFTLQICSTYVCYKENFQKNLK